jgi:hypothetical protein
MQPCANCSVPQRPRYGSTTVREMPSKHAANEDLWAKLVGAQTMRCWRRQRSALCKARTSSVMSAPGRARSRTHRRSQSLEPG